MGGGRRFRRWYLQTRKDGVGGGGGGVGLCGERQKMGICSPHNKRRCFLQKFLRILVGPTPYDSRFEVFDCPTPLFLYIYITFLNLFLYYFSRFQPPIPYLKKRVHCNGSHLPHHFSFSFQNYPCHILGITIQYSLHINMFLP